MSRTDIVFRSAEFAGTDHRLVVESAKVRLKRHRMVTSNQEFGDRCLDKANVQDREEGRCEAQGGGAREVEGPMSKSVSKF